VFIQECKFISGGRDVSVHSLVHTRARTHTNTHARLQAHTRTVT